MPIKLTEEMLGHCYDMLAATPALSKWNLPSSEDIKFKVVKRKSIFGRYVYEGGDHRIEISSKSVGTFSTLISTMAHEMIHLHQSLLDIPVADDKTFHGFADAVCKEFELDRLAF